MTSTIATNGFRYESIAMRKLSSIAEYFYKSRANFAGALRPADLETATLIADLWEQAREEFTICEIERHKRNAFRRAARKYGQECAMTLLCGFGPVSGIIDTIDIAHAVKLARKAASNAFAAHPELREA